MAKVNYEDLLKGSVESITAGFGDHDDDTLAAIAEAEGKGAKRAGLLSAIESEQGSRKLTARARELQETAKGEGITLHTDTDLETAASARAAALEKRVATLEGQLKEAKSARTPARAKAPAKPRKLAVDPTAAGKADRDGGFSVAFTDENDMTLSDVLPDLEFDAGAFEPFAKNDALVLKQPIDFPEGVGRFEISKVWLLDGNDKAVGVSKLVSPLPVGGGSRSRIPEGFLRFDGVGSHAGKKAEA